jgi:hypothetical protein
MRGLGSGIRRLGAAWRACCAALLAALCLPSSASATIFSFGTVNPTDDIDSMTFAPTNTKTNFDPDTGILHIEAFISEIAFSNRPNITLEPNTVILTSDVVLTSTFLVTTTATDNPRSYYAKFTNGMVDMAIVDTVGTVGNGFLPITVLDTEYSKGLHQSATETGPIPTPSGHSGGLTAELDLLGSSDPDFLSAWGQDKGFFNAVLTSFLSDGVNTGNNLCRLVKSGTAVYASQVCPGPVAGFALDDWEANTNGTIKPIPEPGTALLLGLGLAGVAALRRK